MRNHFPFPWDHIPHPRMLAMAWCMLRVCNASHRIPPCAGARLQVNPQWSNPSDILRRLTMAWCTLPVWNASHRFPPCAGTRLQVNPQWSNPSGEWRVGWKRLYDLLSKGVTERVKVGG